MSIPSPSQVAEKWRLLQTGARSAAENMAIDEVLLLHTPVLRQPVLRFYNWSEPAASFGYFQKYADIEKLTSLRPLVRRPTGGGLVPHDADWTYTLVFPPEHHWYRLPAVESYRRVHQWIQSAFAHTGVPTRLASVAQKDAPGQCFIGAEQFDLLWQDRKIAGAAQRRSKQGLLIQGSIQPARDMNSSEWLKAFCLTATREWQVQFESWKLSADLEEQARHLAEKKYSRPEYNCSR